MEGAAVFAWAGRRRKEERRRARARGRERPSVVLLKRVHAETHLPWILLDPSRSACSPGLSSLPVLLVESLKNDRSCLSSATSFLSHPDCVLSLVLSSFRSFFIYTLFFLFLFFIFSPSPLFSFFLSFLLPLLFLAPSRLRNGSFNNRPSNSSPTSP